MKKGRIIFYSLLAVVVVGLSHSRRFYSEMCVACLRRASVVDKSILGITYSHVEKHYPHPVSAYDPVSNLRVATPLDPKLYQEITGHRCVHTFVRNRMMWEFGFRKELIENLYRCYLRVPDQTLAREALAMIDQLYPLSIAKNPFSPGSRPPILHSMQVGSLPNDPLSILYRGLALAGDDAEWRQVLDAAKAGDGSLKLLVDPAILARLLDSPDPELRRQIIDQLAALKNPDAWATIAGCLKDRHVWEHAASAIVYSGQVQYFDQVFEADLKVRAWKHEKEEDPVGYTPGIFDQMIVSYTSEEIRNLLAQGRTYPDRIAFAAIRRQNRFEFLEEVLAVLNKRPSAAAVRAIESLLQGPTPFEAGMRFSDLPRLDPWPKLVAQTNMNPVESLTNHTALGKKSILTRQKIVKLGLQRDPAKWGELRDLYISNLPELGGGETSTAIAQAMAEGDRAKTLEFLLSQLDLDYNRKEQTVAAIAGLGAIADPSSLAPLSNFLKTGARTSFEKHPYYQPFIGYALHRCRGIHRWKLIKNQNNIYLIEK